MEEDTTPRKSLGRWRFLAILFALAAVILLVLIIILLTNNHDGPNDNNLTTCLAPNTGQFGHINLTVSDDPSVFNDLTPKEITGLMKYLFSVPELNLVKGNERRVNSSFVFLSELFLPSKKSILQYLEGKGPKPQREARVIIFRGDKISPNIEEIIAGPLPNPTRYRKHPHRPTSIPFMYRPVNAPEIIGVIDMVTETVDQSLGIMLEDVFDGRLLNCGKKCIVVRYITPVSPALSGEKIRRIWFWMWHFAEYFMLHPLDMAVLVHMDGHKYAIEKVWFNERMHDSLSDVLNYYKANKETIVKIKFPDLTKNLFSSMNQRGKAPIDPPLRNPTQVSPDGKRYNIHGREVEYMFWKFHFGMSPIRGPQMFDIRFKDERIVYELSMQEISVFYSGYKPTQAFANYLDSVGLIGSRSQGLVPGVDCPTDATFIDTHMNVESDGTVTFKNAFCLFEHNMNLPLRRHHSYPQFFGRFYEGMENTVLILRTITSIVNYDYIIDYMFYPNGVIQVKVVSTGYVLGTFYNEHEKPFSFKLQENLAANIHQHLFNFKVDLDIKGTLNRYATANIQVENVPNRFSNDINRTLNLHKFSTEFKSSELNAAYKFNFESPKYLLVCKEQNKIKNHFQDSKCYRIINKGMSKLMLPRDQGNEPSLSWARYQVAITKQKDEEMTSSSMYSIWDAHDPVVNFQSYLDDDESILDKDLVAWVTMGVHHIPHKEDLPVTPTTGMDQSFYLSPYNYFDEDPAISSLNAVCIEPKDKMNMKTSININRYGVKQGLQCVPEKDTYNQQIADNPSIILGV